MHTITKNNNNNSTKMATKDITFALKAEIGRQSGLKRWEKKNGDFKEQQMVRGWFYMKQTSPEVLVELIWDYLQQKNGEMYKKMSSEAFGIKTTIGEYIKKDGSKTLAHYTDKNYYLGSVKKLGENPIHYTGYFQITREQFVIDLELLKEDGNVVDVFVPKNGLAEKKETSAKKIHREYMQELHYEIARTYFVNRITYALQNKQIIIKTYIRIMERTIAMCITQSCLQRIIKDEKLEYLF